MVPPYGMELGDAGCPYGACCICCKNGLYGSGGADAGLGFCGTAYTGGMTDSGGANGLGPTCAIAAAQSRVRQSKDKEGGDHDEDRTGVGQHCDGRASLHANTKNTKSVAGGLQVHKKNPRT
jgi:hypothetical protein